MDSYEEDRNFVNLLEEFSDIYVGPRYRWLRLLLFDDLLISMLHQRDRTGMYLLNGLERRGVISNTNVELLSEIAHLTSTKSAITIVKDYKLNNNVPYNHKKSSRLSTFRKTLFTVAGQTSQDELIYLIDFYKLNILDFRNIYDLIFCLEMEGLLDQTKTKVVRFARCLNSRSRSMLLDGIDSIPIELRAESAEAVAAYTAALEHGGKCIYQTRLMLVGAERVGKTSLVKALTGQTFKEDEETTDGIEILSIKHITNWTIKPTEEKVSIQQYRIAVAEQIVLKLRRKQEEHPESIEEPTEEQIEEMVMMNVTTHKDISDDEIETTSTVPEEITELIINMLRNNTRIEDTVYDLTLSIWDFAGQDAFYITHQIFVVPRAIYILCFNLLDDLNAKAKVKVYDRKTNQFIEYDHHKTNLDFIVFWLTSVYCNTDEMKPSRKQKQLSPPVFIVGTHSESLPGNPEERRALAKKRIKQIKERLKETPYEEHVVVKYYVIDSSNPSDKEIVELRKHITRVAKDEPYMGQKIPIRWYNCMQKIAKLPKEKHLIEEAKEKLEEIQEDLKDIPEISEVNIIDDSMPLEQFILNLKGKINYVAKHKLTEGQEKLTERLKIALQGLEQLHIGVQVIDFERVKQLAKECDIMDETQLFTMLQFYHNLGYIVYYGEKDSPNSALHDIVILDSNWLMRVYKKIFTATIDKEFEGKNKKALRRLDEEGLLGEKLIKELWSEFPDLFEGMLKLMQRFDLLFEKQPHIKGTERLFYAPSLIKNENKKTLMDDPKMSKSLVMLYVDFKEFLHEGLFDRLTVRLLQWSQDALRCNKRELSYQHTKLELGNGHNLFIRILPKNRSYIQVAFGRATLKVTAGTKKDPGKPSPEVCRKVITFLENYLLSPENYSMKRCINFDVYILCSICNEYKRLVECLDQEDVRCGTDLMCTKEIQHYFSGWKSKQACQVRKDEAHTVSIYVIPVADDDESLHDDVFNVLVNDFTNLCKHKENSMEYIKQTQIGFDVLHSLNLHKVDINHRKSLKIEILRRQEREDHCTTKPLVCKPDPNVCFKVKQQLKSGLKNVSCVLNILCPCWNPMEKLHFQDLEFCLKDNNKNVVCDESGETLSTAPIKSSFVNGMRYVLPAVIGVICCLALLLITIVTVYDYDDGVLSTSSPGNYNITNSSCESHPQNIGMRYMQPPVIGVICCLALLLMTIVTVYNYGSWIRSWPRYRQRHEQVPPASNSPNTSSENQSQTGHQDTEKKSVLPKVFVVICGLALVVMKNCIVYRFDEIMLFFISVLVKWRVVLVVISLTCVIIIFCGVYYLYTISFFTPLSIRDILDCLSIVGILCNLVGVPVIVNLNTYLKNLLDPR